jgi:aminoglycoside phosphotransferase family enzyme/predicted kinase
VLLFHDDVVLKFKKPLRFPFADFRNVEARRLACKAEVEANRRLSPDVYLGVADITAPGCGVVDHAVLMRRLPATRSLAQLAVSEPLPTLEPELRRLAAHLASFHRHASRGPGIDAAATAGAVGELWDHCFEALGPFVGDVLDGAAVERLRALTERYLHGRAALFDERIAGGHVCDGHGDLLASDVFLLDDGPRVLDCIEFDPVLRHVDVLADVAFLVMDLESMGAPEVARAFLVAYEAASGERSEPTLFDHYCAERALVRCEVACLRAAQIRRAGAGADTADGGQGAVGEARRLLELALVHAERARVVLGVVSGPPGTGKSTAAAAAGHRLGWPVLRSDEIRRERSGTCGAAHDAATTAATYRTLLERARDLLAHGRSVILDATFTDPCHRRAVTELATATSSDLAAVALRATTGAVADRVRARLAAHADVSDADEAVAGELAARTAAWPVARAIDTTDMGVDAMADAVTAALCATP